ncbi:MAG: MarR family transcriptional regulator [Candidatus Sphingomonas colombiensis]|nr:MarR family transcriptional regulator [Sphingomonas sp.]WEK43386.1 MAG: MarR family transcriptional regulator [Sphingomonas sp.]
MMTEASEIDDAEYAALAEFRYVLRSFLSFSEAYAHKVGLRPQQHQALLAIRGSAPAEATVGHVAERMILKPHSATGLINRLEAMSLITREAAPDDRRRILLRLTPEAYRLLTLLSAAHREEIRRLRSQLHELLARI